MEKSAHLNPSNYKLITTKSGSKQIPVEVFYFIFSLMMKQIWDYSCSLYGFSRSVFWNHRNQQCWGVTVISLSWWTQALCPKQFDPRHLIEACYSLCQNSFDYPLKVSKLHSKFLIIAQNCLKPLLSNTKPFTSAFNQSLCLTFRKLRSWHLVPSLHGK